MTQVADVMTRGVRSLSPADTLQQAARAMDDLNIGVVPVCENDRVVGMVTDRDIVVRGVAQNLAADATPLLSVMSGNVSCCYEDEALEDVTQTLKARQIRRMPVLDRQQRLVGVLSLGDIAAKANSSDAADALAEISEPAEPDRGRGTGPIASTAADSFATSQT